VSECVCVKESRKKQREVEEKRLAADRAAEEARRKAEEVGYCCNILLLNYDTADDE